jgi:hypothetical protein
MLLTVTYVSYIRLCQASLFDFTASFHILEYLHFPYLRTKNIHAGRSVPVAIHSILFMCV